MIKGIVCMGANGVIGKDGTMPWGDKPLDGKRFRSLTEGHVVVMGRKTFESMNYEPLPNRLNVILTSTPKETFNSLRQWSMKDILMYHDTMLRDNNIDVWIIGGAETFKAFMPFIEEWYITTVAGDFEGDTFMPDIFRDYSWKSDFEGQAHICMVVDRPLPSMTYAPSEDEKITRPEIKTQDYVLTYRRLYDRNRIESRNVYG